MSVHLLGAGKITTLLFIYLVIIFKMYEGSAVTVPF